MQRGLATRKASVCLSVRSSIRLSSVWIVTKQKNVLRRFLYIMKEEWLVGAPLRPEILSQTDAVGAKMPILNRYSQRLSRNT